MQQWIRFGDSPRSSRKHLYAQLLLNIWDAPIGVESLESIRKKVQDGAEELHRIFDILSIQSMGGFFESLMQGGEAAHLNHILVPRLAMMERWRVIEEEEAVQAHLEAVISSWRNSITDRLPRELRAAASSIHKTFEEDPRLLSEQRREEVLLLSVKRVLDAASLISHPAALVGDGIGGGGGVFSEDNNALLGSSSLGVQRMRHGESSSRQ